MLQIDIHVWLRVYSEIGNILAQSDKKNIRFLSVRLLSTIFETKSKAAKVKKAELALRLMYSRWVVGDVEGGRKGRIRWLRVPIHTR